MSAYEVVYATPSGEVYQDQRVAPSPEDAAWLTARDLPRDSIKDAPGIYVLLAVHELNTATGTLPKRQEG